MSPPRATLLATVLLAGCGGAARGGSAGAGGPSGGDGDGARIAADAPQSAFVARFPEGRNEYWCQWVEEAGYSADKEFTPIEITAASVKLHPTGETTHFDHFVEYPIDSGDAAYVGERGYSGEQRSVVLADGVLYVLASPAEGAEPAIAFACATKAEQRRIAGVEPRVHRERVRGYAEARRQAFLASAGDLELGDLELGDIDLSDGDDADQARTAVREQVAQVLRRAVSDAEVTRTTEGLLTLLGHEPAGGGEVCGRHQAGRLDGQSGSGQHASRVAAPGSALR